MENFRNTLKTSVLLGFVFYLLAMGFPVLWAWLNPSESETLLSRYEYELHDAQRRIDELHGFRSEVCGNVSQIQKEKVK